jgi:hypothetical protein
MSDEQRAMSTLRAQPWSTRERTHCSLLIAFVFAACSHAPAPTTSPVGLTAPPAELTTIVIPVTTSLAPLVPQVESQVPKLLQKLDAYEMDPQQRFGLKYKVVRDPIALNMQGSGLHATTTIHYALQGCRRTVNPITKAAAMWPCISCGFGEPMRQAVITIDSHLAWDGNWRLRSATKARPVEFPNPCAVTPLNIDVSEWKIGPLVDQQMQDVVKTIDRATPKVTNLRPQAQEIWTALQTPVEIAPKTWLVLEPSAVGLGAIRGSGQSVTSSIALVAQTRVVVGATPAIAAKPLPPLRVAVDSPSGLRVPIDVEVPYDEASRLLSEQFAKRSYDTGGGKLTVDSIRLLPGIGGKLNVEASIDYRGGGLKRYAGLVYLDGTPRFDAGTGSIVIDDVDYSLDPHRRNPFLRTANRLVHETLRSTLRANARWSIASELARVRNEIDRGMNRSLDGGATLKGHVDAIQPVSVVAGPETIALRVVATGTASIELSLAPGGAVH